MWLVVCFATVCDLRASHGIFAGLICAVKLIVADFNYCLAVLNKSSPRLLTGEGMKGLDS